ncbi:MAG TPA: hypothetical protein VF630_11555 [Hymenobacter sp.]|jgi:hypothetical protein
MPDLLAEITNAARAYYAQATAVPLTAADFHAWLDELPPTRRAEAVACGPAASRAAPDFLRYGLEWRGLGMREFMAHRLSFAAFELWTRHGDFEKV